jgi:hypothetical protein
MDRLIEVISNSIKTYLIQNGYLWLGEHIEVVLLALLSTGLFPTVYKVVKYIVVFSRKSRLAKDLHPYFDKSVTDKATQCFVTTKGQNIDPSKEHEPRETHAFATTKEKLIPFFMKKVFNEVGKERQYYLVLADSGMGKTTFMINLFMCYQNQFFGKKYDIKLLPLGDYGVDEAIDKIGELQQLNTILLLDGLDDDSKAWNNHEKRLSDLMQKVRRFREVVITCRTQFFPSAEKEPYETGVQKYDTEGGGQYIFRKIYISPFDDNDIDRYLNKKFGRFAFLNRREKKSARAIVKKSPNLMVRPMLLSYIDDLASQPDGSTDGAQVKYTHTYEIYEVLIDKWIQREAKRVLADRRQEFIKSLYYFSNQVALQIYRNSKGGLFIEPSDVVPLARSFEINLDEIELRGRSLLNRTIEGNCKFAHKSILEYFLAANAYHNRKIQPTADGQVKILASIDLGDFDQAKSFFVEMWLDFRKREPLFDELRWTRLSEDTTGLKEEAIRHVLEIKYRNYVPVWIDSRTLLLKRK